MYSHNLGLSQDPFSIAPDPRFLFMSERHREALAHLLYGVSAPGSGASSSGGAGGGFVLLTGDIGTGKTTICRCFLEQIPASCRVAYIFNPRLTVSELLQSVCEEFHIATAGQPGSGQGTGDAAAAPALSLKQHIDALNAFLLARHAAGESCVLIIDEAQNLLPEVLEQLRLLTNLETNERKLLQIVLIGQPELRTMLQRPELEQLAQRVIARYHLNALNEAETHHYIAHRLAVAGHTGTLPFDARAMTRIHAITRGVPRRINLLCGRALLGAWAHGQDRVNRAVVDKAALEVFGPDALAAVPSRLGQPTVVALAGLVLLGGAAAAVYWSGSWPADPASASSGASTATQAPTSPGVQPPGGLSAATPAAPQAAEPATATASGTAPVANATPATDAAPASAAAATASVQGATGGNPATNPQAPAAPPPSAPPAVEADTLLPRLATQQATAWRSLGAVWLLPPLGGDPCQAAVRQQLQCFQAARLTLPQLRQLGRPGILTLAQDGQRPVYAVLVGLGTQTATLQVGKEQHVVRLASLGRLWQGDFATFWQPPPGFVPELRDGSTGPTIDTLASLLTRAEALEGQTPATAVAASASGSAVHAATGQRLDAALRARVRAFQRTQGLSADGHPGPLTFMQLESALGLHTPRLLTD